MKLTSNEARYLIDHLSEMVVYGDPLHIDTIVENMILAKLVEAYPAETDSVREQREVEQLQRMEANRQQREEEN